MAAHPSPCSCEDGVEVAVGGRCADVRWTVPTRSMQARLLPTASRSQIDKPHRCALVGREEQEDQGDREERQAVECHRKKQHELKR